VGITEHRNQRCKEFISSVTASIVLLLLLLMMMMMMM